MNATVRAILINAAKNAVNAALTALGPMAMWSAEFNLHDWSGIKHVLIIMGSAALAREISVYYPEILKWSQSSS
jgi:hypothetical protein